LSPVRSLSSKPSELTASASQSFPTEESNFRRSSIGLQRVCEFFKRKGISDPYDNVAVESFMKALKYDEIYLKNYDTLRDVLKSGFL